jgi:hypothetical protein
MAANHHHAALCPAPSPPQVEQREKEARQKAKAEAHLYCSVRLARDADMAEQVGGRVARACVRAQ